MFHVPPRTRYDLNFSIFGFDVRIHPFFWVIGILLGWSAGSVEQIALWIFILFISIFIHELGHALMMRRYGVDADIVLYSFGGLAVDKSGGRARLNWIEDVLILLAGPFAGFLFAGIVLGIVFASGGVIYISQLFGFIPIPVGSIFIGGQLGQLLNSAVWIVVWLNTVWGLVNLLPVFPLDGGQISRHLFIRFDPWNGVRNSLWLSVITGALLAVVGYVLLSSIFMAFMFGILALQSYQMIQGGVGPRF